MGKKQEHGWRFRPEQGAQRPEALTSGNVVPLLHFTSFQYELEPVRPTSSDWSTRYGEKHRLQRIVDFPQGITPPTKVRLYSRAGHFVLQWWDPTAKATLSDRVDGELVAAIMRAREIDERILAFRSSGRGPRQVGHGKLIEAFLNDLEVRTNAGEIDPGTVRRYESAIRYYRRFVEQPAIEREYRQVSRVDREFRLNFTAFLAARIISSNGCEKTTRRPMKGQRFILDAVRAMFSWAADPERGGLLPEGFRNPFVGKKRVGAVAADQAIEPDITMPMAIDFVGACDRFQLTLFAPLILFGLRAAEPCFLFQEYRENGWLRMPCNLDLDYRTKGRRDKRFPLLASLESVWRFVLGGNSKGLILLRRSVFEGRELPPLLGASLPEMVEEFRERCRQLADFHAAARRGIRHEVLHDAGGVTYDQIEGEFHKIAKELQWPAAATIKDFRHLFSTMTENGGMPNDYRRYFMGQSAGRAPIVTYTHLDQLREQFAAAVENQWRPLIDAFDRRCNDLSH